MADTTPATTPDATPVHRLSELLDRETVGYAASGALLGVNGLDWKATLAIGIGWQLIEGPLRSYIAFLPRDRHPTTTRKAVDIATMMAAFFVARALPSHGFTPTR